MKYDHCSEVKLVKRVTQESLATPLFLFRRGGSAVRPFLKDLISCSRGRTGNPSGISFWLFTVLYSFLFYVFPINFPEGKNGLWSEILPGFREKEARKKSKKNDSKKAVYFELEHSLFQSPVRIFNLLISSELAYLLFFLSESSFIITLNFIISLIFTKFTWLNLYQKCLWHYFF